MNKLQKKKKVAIPEVVRKLIAKSHPLSIHIDKTDFDSLIES